MLKLRTKSIEISPETMYERLFYRRRRSFSVKFHTYQIEFLEFQFGITWPFYVGIPFAPKAAV